MENNKNRLQETAEKIIDRVEKNSNNYSKQMAVESMIREYAAEAIQLYFNIQVTSLVGKDMEIRVKDWEAKFGIKESSMGKFF